MYFNGALNSSYIIFNYTTDVRLFFKPFLVERLKYGKSSKLFLKNNEHGYRLFEYKI